MVTKDCSMKIAPKRLHNQGLIFLDLMTIKVLFNFVNICSHV